MRKLSVCALVVALVAVVPAFAQKGETGTGMLMSVTADGSTQVVPPGAESTPDSFLNVDVGGATFYDASLSPANTILTYALGDGSSMTGIGWDVTLETIGASWASEAVMYFDGADQDGSGLFLTVGVGDTAPTPPGGTFYSSGGIIDLTDNAIPDIPILADELLYIELFESFVDNGGTGDSMFLAGSTLDIAGIEGPNGGWGGGAPIIEVPTASTVGLIVLFLGIAALGVFVIRR